MAELRRGDVKEQIVAEDFPGIFVQRDDAQFGAFLVGRGEPDLRTPDDGRGPGFAMDGRGPFYVVGVAECQRQIRVIGVAIAGRSAEFGPVVCGEERAGEEGESSEEGADWHGTFDNRAFRRILGMLFGFAKRAARLLSAGGFPPDPNWRRCNRCPAH